MRIGLFLMLLFALVSCTESQGEMPEIEGAEILEMPALDGRPAMLIIGDSISIGYYPKIAAKFPELQVIHNTGNARNTRAGIENIRKWVDHAPEWEVCTINHGLHDVHAAYNIGVDEYIQNLDFEIEVMKERCKKILFITTTKVPKNVIGRANQKVIVFNSAAVNLMNDLSIPVCDIYGTSEAIPALYKKAAEQSNVHFTEKGYAVLANTIENCISNI